MTIGQLINHEYQEAKHASKAKHRKRLLKQGMHIKESNKWEGNETTSTMNQVFSYNNWVSSQIIINKEP